MDFSPASYSTKEDNQPILSDENMPPLKFSANLSFLFAKETPSLIERYALAKQHGFSWVECAYPYVFPAEDVKAAKEEAGVQQVLINSFPGDLTAKEFGFAALPDKMENFRDSLEKSIEYAKALNCKRIHVMAGCKDSRWSHAEMEDCYKANLKYAVERLRREDIIALIEPISDRSIPNYFLDDPEKAFDYIRELAEPNLKYMLDIFHLQNLGGDLTRRIERYWPEVGHIQIAQCPDRTEPMLLGEICYPYILALFEKYGYDGCIGLEHFVTSEHTSECLGWIKEIGHMM